MHIIYFNHTHPFVTLSHPSFPFPRWYLEWCRGWQPMSHTCKPSCSGGREQEDHDSNPAWTNTSQDPILKILSTKRAGRVAQLVKCLHCNCEALNSNNSTTTRKRITKCKHTNIYWNSVLMYYYISFKEGRLKRLYVGILFHENSWPVKFSNCGLGLIRELGS
jgi:hypothetical protein